MTLTHIQSVAPISGIARVRKKGYPAQSKTFETKPEAKKWAAVIESEMARGMFVSRAKAESTTFKQLLIRYLRRC